MNFQLINIQENKKQIKADNFAATLKMNIRDAMIYAVIDELPNDNEDACQAIKEFKQYLEKQVGGKILLKLSPELMQKFSAVLHEEKIFDQANTKAPIYYIEKDQLLPSVDKFKKNEKINKINKNTNISFLLQSEDYEGKYAALDQFKKENSSFTFEICGVPIYTSALVTQQKIETGLYSAEAEEKKVNNEFVQHFAIFDKKSNAFLATLQVFIDNDLAYVSDVMVANEMRRNGLAQALVLHAFESLEKTQNIQGVWFIGGGAGVKLLKEFFDNHDLPLQKMTPKLQNKLGCMPIFTAPKSLLLQSGLHAPQPSKLKPYFVGALFATAGVALAAGSYLTFNTQNRM